jgi:hypothetical protein
MPHLEVSNPIIFWKVDVSLLSDDDELIFFMIGLMTKGKPISMREALRLYGQRRDGLQVFLDYIEGLGYHIDLRKDEVQIVEEKLAS